MLLMKSHLLWFVALLIPVSAMASEEPKPVKVFILAGQSNMEGQAVVDLSGKDYNDGKGTLESLFRDPAKAPLVKHLKKPDGTWAVREDVWVRYQREDEPLLAGPLAVGFSVYGDRHHFGPELQFGHVLGDYFENQVLLIKTAWGGKSLFEDFRPPSSGGKAGPYYTKMIAEIHEALAKMPSEFPGKRTGFELAGFVWYHGWNDGVDPQHAVPEYEQNLCNLIRDIRKEFGVPRLPVVIGELTGPWVEVPGEWATLRGTAERGRAARVQGHGPVRRDARFRAQAGGFSKSGPRASRVRQCRDVLPGWRRTRQGDDPPARADEMEFFAEMTEAFFGVNDFYPFNSAELREAEPELFRLLTSIWQRNG